MNRVEWMLFYMERITFGLLIGTLIGWAIAMLLDAPPRSWVDEMIIIETIIWIGSYAARVYVRDPLE